MYMQRLLFLSVLLWSHAEAIVVDSVSDCAEFFLRGTPPQIPGVLEDGKIKDQNRYKIICQTYKNRRRFFTLYDTSNKIPVFSAYIFKDNQWGTKRPGGYWLTEPQLETNMQTRCGKPVYENQATFYNYINKDYDRGHLFPSSYGETQDDKSATFTLTNAVPQDKTFNNGSWNKMENCTKCVMKKHCINNNNKIEGFLVTGAEPGDKKLNDKINIPSVMWSAFCCYNNKEDKWFASAHWGNNVKDLTKDQYLETQTLNQLYFQFRKNTDFKLFPDECPLHDTVTQFYPELNAENKYCNCPPIKSPVENSPDDKSPDDKTPDDKTPDDKTPDDKTPDDKTPDDKTPDDKLPDDKTPDDKTPDDKLLDDKTPDDKTPDDKTPDDKTPDDKTPDDKLPDDKTPDDKTPDDKTPDDKTPDDKTPDDKTPDDKTPDDKTPDDKTPDDKLPDDKSNDDKSNDDKSPDNNSPDDISPDDKSPDDKSNGDKSPDDKSPGDKTLDDRSNDNKSPDNNSPDDKSPDNNSPDDKSPDKSNDDKSPDDKSNDDKSNDDKSPDDKTPDDKSPDNKSNDDKSNDDKSNDDRSNDDKSPDDKSPDDKSPDDYSPDDKSLDDKPSDHKSAVDTVAIDSPVVTAIQTIKSYLSEAYGKVCSLIQRLKQGVGL